MELFIIDDVVLTQLSVGGGGMVGIRLEAKDEPLLDDASSKEEELSMTPASLRFQVGQRLECRTGPDPVNDWIKVEITQSWYREAAWSPNSWAPYQIQLDNGKRG